MAIFQSRLPTEIGPVRSARMYYVAWAAEWNAVYAHAGGSPQALATLRARGDGDWVHDANEFRYGNFFERHRDRFSPHNLYTDGERLADLGRRLGAENVFLEPVWKFVQSAPEAERPYGGKIVVPYPYNTVTYQYQHSSNSWPRSVSGEGRQFDQADGERIAPRNVVIQYMSFAATGAANKHRLEADYVGEGKALIFVNGRMIDGSWRKTSETRGTYFYDEGGIQVRFATGQTFINVVPLGTSVKITESSDTPPPPSPSADPSAGASVSPAP
jgi:hypothetical protein